MTVCALFKPGFGRNPPPANNWAPSGLKLTFGFAFALVMIQPATGQLALTQSPPAPDWQTAAGGKMEFEVASIRLSKPDAFTPPNFALNLDDTPIPPGGRFSADFRLETFVDFAYKIMPTRQQTEAMLAHLPRWALTDHFVIEARAEGNPTKDQMRLMVQSLLADRFKLATHFESREVPVLALVPVKPGKTGPRLQPHFEGLACDAKWVAPPDRSSPSLPPGGFMPVCGAFGAIAGPDHSVLLGARDTSLQLFANYLPTIQDLGRPVVDWTGLSGRFDFSLTWTPEPKNPSPLGAETPPDPGGTTLFEAVKEQLGLKLEPAKAPVQFLVIDHVEQPSPN